MTAPVLRCDALTVELGGSPVVKDVSLQLEPGEWLSLIGPNGAGKSSLLRAVAGLIGHEGIVSLDTAAGPRRPGPKDVAVVPQSPARPAGMTVTEYVLLGRTVHLGWLAREGRKDRAKVAEVLARLGLGVFASRRLTSLSGGEFQRVVLARALAQEAPILLLDEPTSALDIGHQACVLELVDNLRQADGLSVLAVMHDLTSGVRHADRIALMNQGQLVHVGLPDDVLQADRLSAVYGAPLTVRRIDGELVVLPAPRNRRADGGTDERDYLELLKEPIYD